MASIEGIYSPHMVPLDHDGRIHEAELRRYVDWLIDRGVGLYPNGSTGEFVRFTPEERQRITKIVCEQAAGRAEVLAGAAEANTRETLRACETYASYGARAVAVVAPFYYRLGPESVYAYFREIAVNSPIDVTLYNIPLFASPIDTHTVLRLMELDRVVALKDSSADVGAMSRILAAAERHRPDFAYLCGWESVLAPCVLMGASGGTNATAGLVPEVLVQLYQTARAGDVERSRSQQRRFMQLFDEVVYGAGFPEGLRAALELRGFSMGPSRQPQTAAQEEALASLQQRLRPILEAMTA